MEKTLPTFGVSFAKPFLLKMGYFEPFKIVAFWTFHISVFVNTIAMMVSYGTKLGPVDLSSDVPPGRGIWWPIAVLHQVNMTFGQPLGQADLWSDGPPGRGILWPRVVPSWVQLT